MAAMLLLSLSLALFRSFSAEAAFRCPQSITMMHDNAITASGGIFDVCMCLDRLRKIQCRMKMYDAASFAYLPKYMDLIRRSTTYDAAHLASFYLCINVDAIENTTMTNVRITADAMSEVAFDYITIAYCDHRHSEHPIHLFLAPDFLSSQIDALQKLEIEIPQGSATMFDEKITQKSSPFSLLLFNLAKAIMRLKRLTKLTLWLDVGLRLRIPNYLFAIYSPQSYTVPLEDIYIGNHYHHHRQQQQQTDEYDHHHTSHSMSSPQPSPSLINETYQALRIGSHAFLHLKWLRSITLENVMIESVEAYAFAAHWPISRVLTINFTACHRLWETQFDPETFAGITRSAIIVHIDSSRDQSRLRGTTTGSPVYVPTRVPFAELLRGNAQNRLKIGYKIDCANRTIADQLRWMFDPENWLSKKQIELRCSETGKSIFAYRFAFDFGKS